MQPGNTRLPVMPYDSILIAGAGNMGGAMLDGWVAGQWPAEKLAILSPNRSEAPSGVRIMREPPEDGFDVLVLGFKPYMLGDLAPGLQDAARGKLVVSVLAGVELATLAKHFPDAAGRMRLMPNIACALGKSPLPLVTDGEVDRAAADSLLAPLGSPEWLADEAQFDLVTALAGSGPAFLYRFIDALAAGAHELGLPDEQAQRLATSMVEGAAALAAGSEHDAGELARRVASPGGVTQAGLDVLDEGNAIRELLAATLRCARDRSAQMSEEAKKTG